MSVEKVKESKFLSLVLRHEPHALDLNLDDQGWALVDELIANSQRSRIVFSRELLENIVESCDKQRFQFNEDKTKIRCHQGHSLNLELGLEAIEPPEFLFHGTATRFLDSILSEGLKKQARHHVHLSPDIQTARSVGSRYGKVAILQVLAQKMFADGFEFYLSGNGVWLTDSVPASFLAAQEDN